MFGLFGDKAIQETTSDSPKGAIVIALEAPKSQSLKLSEEEAMREWLVVAKELAASPQQIGEVELKLWLKEECIPMFNTQSVFDYLCAKAGEKIWSFQGLRKCDSKNTLHAYGKWPPRCGNVLTQTLYSKVPLAVLLTVKRVLSHFGDRANFFVTHMGDPDPFLAVTVDDCAIVFVERWDEPSYRS